MITGYDEVTKAFFSMASQMARKGILEVKVPPCVITGSLSPSYISTTEEIRKGFHESQTSLLTFHAAATVEQGTNVSLDGALTDQLVSDEIGIMRGRYVVLWKRPVHVMVDS